MAAHGLDAAGLALFSVAGAAKPLDFRLAGVMAVLMGAITGVGGGTVRDASSARRPTGTFRPREPDIEGRSNDDCRLALADRTVDRPPVRSGGRYPSSRVAAICGACQRPFRRKKSSERVDFENMCSIDMWHGNGGRNARRSSRRGRRRRPRHAHRRRTRTPSWSRLVRLRHRLDAEIARRARRWDARGVWQSDGSRAPWARLSRTASSRRRHRQGDHASRPASATMPVTAEAFAAGRIGTDHVDLLARAAGEGRHRAVRPR